MGSQDLSLEVGTKLAGGTQQAFSAVANGMRLVAESIRVNATALSELGKAAKSKALSSAATQMNKLAVAAETQVATLEKLVSSQEKFNGSQTKSAAEIDKKVAALARASDALEKEALAEKAAAKSVKEKEAAGAKEAVALQKKAELIQHLRVAYYQLLQGKDRFSVASRKILENFKASEIAARGFADGIIFLNKQQRKSATELRRFNTNLNTLRTTYHSLLTGTGELSASANKIVASFEKQGASLAKQKISIKEVNAELRKLSITYKEAGNSQRGLALSARKTASTIKKLSIRYKELVAAGGRYSSSFTRLMELFRSGKMTIGQVTASLSHLSAAYKKSVAAGKRLALAQQRVYASFPKYGKQIAMLERQGIAVKEQISLLHRYSAAQEQANTGVGVFRKGVVRLLRSFKAYASYIIASSAIFALIRIFSEAKKAVTEYDQALRDLQAITGATYETTQKMGAKILQIASDTKFSATEAAEGMRVLGQAGFSAQESIDTIGAVANLATGTLTSLSTTVDLVTTALRVFDIKASDSGKVADIFANAVNKSKLNIDKMRIAMNYIGPIANAAGISLKETAAAMMTMANQGIRASTIGTGLRQVFRRLVDPSIALEKGLSEVNLTLEDINPKTHNLADILTKLQVVVKGNADAFHMFGRRGATAVIALTKKGGAGLLNLLKLVNRTGSAADMAGTQMEGLGVSAKNLSDKIKNLYIAMGKGGLAGALQFTIDAARGLTDFFTGVFSNSLVQLVSKLTLVAGAAQLLVVAFKWLINSKLMQAVFSPLITGLAVFRKAMAETELSVSTLKATMLGLNAAFMEFLPAAIIIGIVYVIQKIALFDDKLKENIRQLGAQKRELRDNIDALDAFSSKLANTTVRYNEQTALISELIVKYPELAGAIAKAGRDTAAINKILNNFNSEQKKLLKEKTLEKLRKEFVLFNKQVRKESHIGARMTPSWLLTAQGVKEANIKIAESNHRLGVSAKKLADDFAQAKKAYPKITIEQFTKDLLGLSGDPIKLEVVKRVKDVLAAEKVAIERAKNETKRGTQKDKYALLSPIELKNVALDLAKERDNAIANSEAVLQKNLYDISVLEAEGVDSHADAEKKKLALTTAAYQKQLDIAKKYVGKITDTGSFTVVASAEKKAAAIQKKVNQARLRQLQQFSQQSARLKTKLSRDTEKEESKKQTYIRKTGTLRKKLLKGVSDYHARITAGILAIDKRYAREKERIETSTQAKIKRLLEKRKEIERSTQNDIKSIHDSIQDRILQVQQRGMSAQQKDVSTQTAANERLAQGIKLVAKAKEKADKDMLSRAQALIKKAGDYYESLKNNGAAITGLQQVGKALENARKLQGKMDAAALDNQITKVKSIEEAKLALLEKTHNSDLASFKKTEKKKFELAQKAIKDQIRLETKRHKNEMAHLEAEIRLLKQKLELIHEQAQGVASNIGGASASFSTGGPIIHMASGGRLPGKDSQSDTVPVLGRPGEWFIRNEAVKHWTDSLGSWFMGAVNAPSSTSGKHLEALLGMNASLASRSINMAKSLAAGAQRSFQNLGVVNINLPTSGPPIPALMSPMDANEFIKQLNTMNRLAAT